MNNKPSHVAEFWACYGYAATSIWKHGPKLLQDLESIKGILVNAGHGNNT